MTDQEITRFHVVLIPHDIQVLDIIELSQTIDKDNDNIVTLGPEVIPHITLYAPDIPEKNFAQACLEIRVIVENMGPMELDFLAYDKAPLGDDGLFINFNKSEGLSVLQRKIIAAVNPLRETVSRNKWPDDKQCVIESIEYGYPISRYHFPHITLGKFFNTGKRDAALQSLQDNQGSPLRIKSVAVVEPGEHGTAKKIIKEYLL